MDTSRPVKFSRFGLDENPVGFQVMLKIRERTYLGDVTGFYRREGVAPVTMLKVRHFNGEPWPFDPAASAVRVLDRSWPEEQSNG